MLNRKKMYKKKLSESHAVKFEIRKKTYERNFHLSQKLPMNKKLCM